MNEHALPMVLAEIAQVAGYDAAWAIAGARGGQEISLPRQPGRNHRLTRLVGAEAAVAICRHFRAEHRLRILVPMGSALRQAQRVNEVLDGGASVHGAAAALGVHKRTIYRYRAKRGATAQPSLFGEDD